MENNKKFKIDEEEQRVEKNNRIALLIKNRLDEMICPIHNEKGDWCIMQNLEFHYNTCCCKEFEKDLIETEQNIIEANR